MKLINSKYIDTNSSYINHKNNNNSDINNNYNNDIQFYNIRFFSK